MLVLRDKRWENRPIKYGNAFCAPGARNFYGFKRNYTYNRFVGAALRLLTFVAKTTTLERRAGNLPLRADGVSPRELLPRSIIIKWRSGHVLNAVGLCGPGAKPLLESGHWQARNKPFMLSFMAVSATKSERLEEMRQFVRLMLQYLPYFRAPVALQINFACPNTGHPPAEFYNEILEMLEIASALEIPLVPNFNPTVPGPVMLTTAMHPACSALWIANTIPWGDPRINWEAIFGTTESPLLKRNLPIPSGGGLSGPACLPLTVECVLVARDLGIEKPIIAGNGVQKPSDVRLLRRAGADAVAIGIGPLMRPFSAKATVAEALRN